MHVLIGLAITLVAFGASLLLHEATTPVGLFNPSALVLLVLGPIGVTVLSHPFRTLSANLEVLVKAFQHDRRASLTAASEEIGRIARALRESRWGDAEAAVASARAEQVRLLAPHLLERLEEEALHEAVASSAFGWMAEVKASDDLLQGLARYSPAFGMIGTIMGLVDLFKNLQDSSSLGPGMAMALLATLYGLVLCYCVYMPLSQRVRTYLTSGAQEQRLVERAIYMVHFGRPVHEVSRAVLDGVGDERRRGRLAAPGPGPRP